MAREHILFLLRLCALVVKDFSLLLPYSSCNLFLIISPLIYTAIPSHSLLLSSCLYTCSPAVILSVSVPSALLLLFQLLLKLLGREELLRRPRHLPVLYECWSLKEILQANFKMSAEGIKIEFSLYVFHVWLVFHETSIRLNFHLANFLKSLKAPLWWLQVLEFFDSQIVIKCVIPDKTGIPFDFSQWETAKPF